MIHPKTHQEAHQDTHPETHQEKTEVPSKQKSQLGLWLILILTLVIAIISIIMNCKLAKTITQELNQKNANLKMLMQQQSITAARLQAYRTITATHENRAKAAQKALEKKMMATLQEQCHVADDWRLLKARYLLELAYFNTHWGNDTASTCAMLKAADTTLAPLHNPALLAVREALAADIQTLKNSKILDITGLIAQLHAASNITWQLPNHPLSPIKAVTSPNTDFWKNLVTIRHIDNALTPEPTLAYEALLRASIRFSLQEAEWAILEKNNAIYQQALQQVLSHLDHSFISDAKQTQTLIAQIKALQTITLNTTPPPPEKALNALNQVIENLDNQTIHNANDSVGETP